MEFEFDRLVGKSGIRPEIFRVRPLSGTSDGKPRTGVEIFHVLEADGAGLPALATVATAQEGLVHERQLRAAQLDKRATHRLVRAGVLHPVLPRVFAFGSPSPAAITSWFAASLYLNRDFVLSHGSAAELWRMVEPPKAQVEATLIGRGSEQRAELKTHRVSHLLASDVRFRHGLPVTAPARTLIDVAADSTELALEDALAEARVLRLVTDDELEAAMARCPLRSGVGRLRALMRDERGPAFTRSRLERRLRALVNRAQLPVPIYNAPLLGFRVDALWPQHRLVLESDGYDVHGHRRAFERDSRRGQVLVAHGFAVVRVTWRQLNREPLAVLARLAAALALASPGP